MDKKRIKEVIIVEGRHDTENIKKYYDCETIETNGTCLSKEILKRISQASIDKGVIVFTDPDAPGNQIRAKINEQIPSCKNAYVLKKDARTSKKVGIEHASYQVLQEALENLVTEDTALKGTLTADDLLELHLTGNDSAENRSKVGEFFHIGFGNAKTIRRRLNSLNISKEQLKEVLK